MTMFKSPKPKKQEQDAIIVENVSKRFRIPHEKKTRLFEHIVTWLKGNSTTYEEFWAVKDVSFRVKKGETIGIIGENGSGKSTLLKIIAGVLWPDSGSVKVNGSIAPFLELGVGFQPELTAEENVYLYGSIMGMNRAQIKNKINDIFDFAELERFRNAKLKNFSSGMYARLAFSTAISTDPDIILIDEALAVGDEAFQKKCYDKINEFRGEGKTIIFVSHGMDTVKQLCERSILLNHGKMSSIGYSEKVVNDYRDSTQKKEEENLRKQHEKTIDQMTVKQEVEQHPLINNIKVEEKQPDRWGSREIEINDVQFYNNKMEKTNIFTTGDKMCVRMKYFAKERIEKPVFGVAIHRKDGVHINGTNCKFYNNLLEYMEGEGEVEYNIDSLPLLEGTYLFTAAIYDYNCVNPYDHHERKFIFKVIKDDVKDVGLIYIPCEWKYK